MTSAIVAAAAMAAALMADVIIGVILFLIILTVCYHIRKKTGINNLCLIYGSIYLLSYIYVYIVSQQTGIVSFDSNKSIAATAVGTIESVDVKDNYKSIVLKNVKITTEDENIIKTSKLLVTGAFEDMYTGDTVKIQGQLTSFDKARNEGGFDSKNYYASIKIFYKLKAKKAELLKTDRQSVYYYISVLRERLKAVYKDICEEKDYGIFCSMVLGDKSDLDMGLKQLYQKNGIAHLLAISGLHISLIGMTFYNMLRKLGSGITVSSFTGLSVIVIYTLLTGWGISAVRAMLMCSLMITAKLLGRTYDIFSSLGTAALFLMIDNPYVLLNAGFQLSFLAVLGIALFVPVLEEYKKNIKNTFLQKILGGLFVSISVNLMTLPILLYDYYGFPIWSILLNVMVVPLMTMVMMSAVVALTAGFFMRAAGVFLIALAHYILQFYEALCLVIQKLPYAQIITGRPKIEQILLYYGGLFLMLYLYNNREKLKLNKHFARIFQFALVGIAAVILLWRKPIGFEIDMIDVGQGDGIFLATPEQKYYLFDGGSSDEKQLAQYTLEPFLQSKGIARLDYAVISHCDEDHINGVVQMIERKNIAIGCIILPRIKDYEAEENYCKLLALAKEENIPVQYVNAGDNIGTKQVLIKCVHPSKEYNYNSANDYSAVYCIQYKQFKMLMTGDAQKTAEDEMLSNDMLCDVDVLKVGHHGAKTSSSLEFLEKIQPQTALISCGKNNRYNHPSQETINRLTQLDIYTYVTANTGEIKIKSDGSRYWIRQWRR